MDDSLKLLEHQLVYIDFLSDQIFGLILRIVAIAESAIITELKFEKFMTKFAFVSNIVAQIKFLSPAGSGTIRSPLPLICHSRVLLALFLSLIRLLLLLLLVSTLIFIHVFCGLSGLGIRSLLLLWSVIGIICHI